MLTLHTLTNNYDEGEIYHQFLQEGRQPLLESRALASELTLGDFLSENIIEPLGLTKKRDKDHLEGLRQNGLVARLLDAAVRLNMKDFQAGYEAFETHFGDWEFDSLVIQEPTLRELQEDVWKEAEDYTFDDWREEVGSRAVTTGYWEWVENKRDQAHNEA